MGIKQIVGDNIRHIREIRGLTQEELSVLTKMSKTFLGDIERAQKSPTTVSLEKIAKALGVKPSVLLEPEAYREIK
ncbi:MAG TPA: helix-turn-helix transcriptional regulator [Candidatus Kapabacteria bacterium]|nr:helix-turn-helix transcriptional regulator [Candidatus Kapabacteria bacterium]